MRTFKFPEEEVCIVCNTNKPEDAVLIGIDGTQEGYNIEAKPIHLDCLLQNLRIVNQNNETYIAMKC